MLVVVAGAIAGLVASVPLLVADPTRAQIGRGFAALIFAFLFLSAAILASRRLMTTPELFMAFSVVSILTYLGIVAARMVSGVRRLA